MTKKQFIEFCDKYEYRIIPTDCQGEIRLRDSDIKLFLKRFNNARRQK